jgi:hypothetical protein
MRQACRVAILKYWNTGLRLAATKIFKAGWTQTMNLSAWYGFFTPKDALERAMAAALRAVEIDPGLAEGHAALGFARGCDRDWAGA